MVFQNNVLAGASNVTGEDIPDQYLINQSIRFNAADSVYLNRTPSSAGNQKTWTLSWWFKRGNLSTNYSFFNRRTGSGGATNFLIYLMTDDRLQFYASNGSTIDNPITTRKFRDQHAWYHCVATLDTTQTPVDQRFRVYVNGVREELTGDTFLYDTNYLWNDAQNHAIGRQNYQNDYYLDAYMAEIVFIDGTSHDATSFGEYNSKGIWIPKKIYDQSFTFGTNGFYLTGQNADYLGYDYQTSDRSGTTNDFTASANFNPHDQVPDSPTNNFCTLSKINMGTATGVALRDGNLDGRTSGTAGNAPASISLDSGKWYWEVNNHADGSGNTFGAGETPTGSFHHFTLGSGGNQINTNSVTVSSLSSGTIIGFKLDLDAGTLQHTTDGSSYTSTGSLTANTAYAPYSRLGSSSGRVVFNFGQDSTFGGLETAGGNSDGNGVGDFYYNVPSGFSAICTKNLGES